MMLLAYCAAAAVDVAAVAVDAAVGVDAAGVELDLWIAWLLEFPCLQKKKKKKYE